MTNKKVCDYCGTIYAAELGKCPLCGSVEHNFDEIEPEAAAQPRAERNRTAGKTAGKKAARKKEERPYGKMPKGLLIGCVIFLSIAVFAMTWHIIAQFFPSFPSLSGLLKSTNAAEEVVHTQDDKQCWYLNCDADEITFEYEGASKTLVTDIQPTDCVDKITYLSQDTSVATVDESGTIVAVGNGTTYVIVTCGKQKFNVTVTCDFKAKAALNQETVSFASLSQTVTLKVMNLTENETVSWESTDEGVATVDSSGVVKPVADGTCSIIALTGELTFKAEVTVKLQQVPTETETKTGTINTNSVNFRATPSTTGDIIGYFNKGDEVTVLGTEDGWCHVQAGGLDGYVSEKFVEYE